MRALEPSGRQEGLARFSEDRLYDVTTLPHRHSDEEVEFRTQKFTVNQQFGRSMSREKALSAEPLLAYTMNGEPLTKHQGFPLRLIVPGWYGVGNVKW